MAKPSGPSCRRTGTSGSHYRRRPPCAPLSIPDTRMSCGLLHRYASDGLYATGPEEPCEVVVLVDLQHPALENLIIPFREKAKKKREKYGRLERGLPSGKGQANGGVASAVLLQVFGQVLKAVDRAVLRQHAREYASAVNASSTHGMH